MKKFSFLIVLVMLFSFLFAEETDEEKQKSFYKKQYERFIVDDNYLQAYSVLQKMKSKFSDLEEFPNENKLENAIFVTGKSSFANYNADKAVKYLDFYVQNFTAKRDDAFLLLAEIYQKAGDQEKADFYKSKLNGYTPKF